MGGRSEGTGRVGSKIKKHDEKRLGGWEINGRWKMKKGSSRDRTPDRGREKRNRGGEVGRGVSVLRLIIIGLTVGDGLVLLLGGTCVFRGRGWRIIR